MSTTILKKVVFLSSFVLAYGALAAGIAVITEGTLTVHVDEGSDLNFSEVTGYAEALGALQNNAVTDLVKTGAGRVCVEEDLSAYVGTIHVNAGLYAYTTKDSLGADAQGADVYVADGATLEASPADQFPSYFTNKTTHFQGTGAVVNGESCGALLKTGKDCWRGPFGKYLIMEGDVLVRTKSATHVYFASAELRMNGHNLTYIMSRSNDMPIWSSVTVVDPGNIYLGDGSHATAFLWDQSMAGANGEGKTWTLRANDVLTLRNDSAKQVLPKWTLQLLGNATLKNDSGRQTDAWLMDTDRYCWAGPIDLGDSTLTINPTYTLSDKRNHLESPQNFRPKDDFAQ